MGQLRFAAGATVAEFKASASLHQPAVHTACAVQQATHACSSAPAHATTQPTPRLREDHSPCQKETACQQSSTSSSHTGQQSSSKGASRGPICHTKAAAAAAVSLHPLSATAAMPEKPSNCDYNPTAAWEIAREVRTAAAQNRRVKAPAFVLPAGDPCEPDEPRMPQGKAKANKSTVGKQQVGESSWLQEFCKAVLPASGL